LKDRVNAIAAAAFSDIKRVVEDPLAAEIIVLAGLVFGSLLAKPELQQWVDLRRIAIRDDHVG